MDFDKTTDSKKLLTLSEAAQRLNVTPDKLLAWNEQNILKPTITLEGRIVYSQDQLDQFLKIRHAMAQVERENLPQPEQNLRPSAWQVEAPPENSAKMNAFSLKSLSYGAMFILVLAVVLATQFATAGSAPSIADSSSTLELSHGAIAKPINKNLTDESPSLKSAPEILSIQPPKETSVSAKLASSRKKTLQEIAKNNEAYATIAAQTSLPFASKIAEVNTPSNSIFDTLGNIRGQAGGESLGSTFAINALQQSDALRLVNPHPKRVLTFLAIGLLLVGLFYHKKFAYVFKSPVQVASNFNQPQLTKLPETVLEVDQKTDGTVVAYFQGKEYKISKPELYSESDRFIEKLIDLAKSGAKEIEYDAMKDEGTKLTTPLSRLVTRLGFVGVKRDLFFPRTSKDRVLFRRYLTTSDIESMSLSTDNISSHLEFLS